MNKEERQSAQFDYLPYGFGEFEEPSDIERCMEMHRAGYSVSLISRNTGLDPTEVRKHLNKPKRNEYPNRQLNIFET